MYKIKFLIDSSLGKAGTEKIVSFEDYSDFIMENLKAKKMGFFKVEEEIKTAQAAPKVKKSDTEDYQDALEEYYETLPAWEILSIKQGTRIISHSQTMGFYLRDAKSAGNVLGSAAAPGGIGTKGGEINISISHIREKHRREIFEGMKKILMASISGQFYFDNDLFDQEDLKEMVNELFKGKA